MFLEFVVLSIPISVMCSFGVESGRLDDGLSQDRDMVMLAKSHKLHIGT